MNERQIREVRNESHRVRFVGFLCPRCGGLWLIWRRRKGFPIEALIWEFAIIEGNTLPTIFGYYEDRAELGEVGDVAENPTWSCADCGHVPTDIEGSPVHSVSDMMKYLVINCDPYGREMNLDPTKSLEDLNQLVFNEIDRIFEKIPSQKYDLRCPSCGHDEFIEKKLLIIRTPVRVENSRPRWIYEERLWDEKMEGLGNSYFCSNCGFELPEPLEE